MLGSVVRIARSRDALCAWLSILLLAIVHIAPNSRLVMTLQGTPRIERELSQAQTEGYYEELLDASPIASQGTHKATARSKNQIGWVPFGAAGIIENVPSYIRWRMRPNLDLRWNGSSFHTNRLGYRTPEITLEKTRDDYRIVIFGSSNTMGHGVSDEEAYPRLLEPWLNERFGSTRRVQVVNLAVSGDSPSRRLQRLREEGGRFRPDWLICDLSALDYSLEERHLRAMVRSSPPIHIPFAFVRTALSQSGVTPQDSLETFQNKLRGQFEALFDGAYAGWNEEARRLGVPLTVILLPRADRKESSPRIYEIMLSIAHRQGLDVLDLSDAFLDLTVSQFRVSDRDMHPSALGHKAIFDRLREALLQRGGLPGLAFPDPG